ncbi:MAG: hypothetical protein RI963_1236 [Planctomycetota bacterium]|jgi:hypothetical protein
MFSTRWRLWALIGVFASPLMTGAKEIDFCFTNFERPTLEVGSEGEPWDPLITRITDPHPDADGFPRLFRGPGMNLAEHLGILGKAREKGRRQGFVLPATNREGLIYR